MRRLDSYEREIVALLRDAERCIRWHAIECAAWRLADAGALLRDRLETLGHNEGQGISKPTGLGAMLPVRRRRSASARRGYNAPE